MQAVKESTRGIPDIRLTRDELSSGTGSEDQKSEVAVDKTTGKRLAEEEKNPRKFTSRDQLVTSADMSQPVGTSLSKVVPDDRGQGLAPAKFETNKMQT